MGADLIVARLTDAIAEVQAELGVERTRKLLFGLAEGLGAPETSAREGGCTPTQARPQGVDLATD